MKTMLVLFLTTFFSSPAFADICGHFDKMVEKFIADKAKYGAHCEQKPNPKPAGAYPEDQVDLYQCTWPNGGKEFYYASGKILPRPNGDRCIFGIEIRYR